MIELPQRPKDDDLHKIPKLDKQILVYRTLMQCSNSEAFLRFHPEYATPDWKTLNKSGVAACKQFFTWNKNKAFAEAYEATIADFLGCKQQNHNEDTQSEISDKRKEGALKSLFDKAMTLVEGRGELDADTLKIAAEIFKKIGLLKDDETEQQMKPIRVLPLRCWGDGCRYRLFCESMVLEGSAIDECQFCKARAKAAELGYKFKDTELLDIPEDVVKRLEEKNDVKLEDIVSGRIPN